MNLKEQLYICKLAKYGNITKASERLFISQPALSAFISGVEGELGVKLFERTSKGMLLTEGARSTCATPRTCSRSRTRLQAITAALRSQKTSRLRAGIQQRRASFCCPRRGGSSCRCIRRFPEITEGTGEALMEALDGNEIDMAVVTAADLPGPMTMPSWGRPHTACDGRENPLNQHARPRTGARYPLWDLNHVREETFILQQPDQSIRVMIDTILRQAKIKPTRVIGIRNIETAVQFAGENLGVAFTRESYVRNDTKNSKVAYYYINNSRILEKVVVTWRKNVQPTAPMKALTEALRGVYNAADPE